jgi:hypothetical protein
VPPAPLSGRLDCVVIFFKEQLKKYNEFCFDNIYFDMIVNKNKVAMSPLCMFPPALTTTEGFTGKARFVPNFCGLLFPRLAYEQVDSSLG